MTTTATKTTRRTAKITTKSYTPSALTRVYDKASGVCLGYLAPSRDNKETYQVTCDEYGHWHCTCKATIENCVHVKAAKELCAIRVKQGRPACRAASLPEPEMSEDDREQLAIVVAAMTADVTAELVATPAPGEVVEEAQPARELRNVYGGGEYWPQYRDEAGNWQYFPNGQGWRIHFAGGCEDLAREFIAVDSDEHRRSVLAKLQQMIDEQWAEYDAEQSRKHEPVRDLVAVAAANAAQAGPAIDRKFADSEQRLSSVLNGRVGVLMPARIAAPVIAASRVPMR